MFSISVFANLFIVVTQHFLLSYGVKIEHLIVLLRNPIFSDHNLLTFDFSLSKYKPLIKNSFSRCLPDSAVAKFKEIIPMKKSKKGNNKKNPYNLNRASHGWCSCPNNLYNFNRASLTHWLPLLFGAWALITRGLEGLR